VDKPLDDEFAKEMGAESVDDLRSKITERLEQQYSSVSRDRVKRVLLDRLAEETGFDLPTGMVDQEFEGIWQQVEQQREQNPDEEEFQRPDEELRQEYRDIAARRVRIGLILSDVARAQEITVNQDELGQAVLTQARQFPGQEKEVFEYYRNNPQATEQLRAPILEDKVVDYILELAEITDKDVEIEELMRDPDEAAAEEKAEKKPAKKTAAKKSAKAADDKKPAAKKAAASKKSSTKSAAKSKATSESDG
ncbi:MAG: trigger factor, partial [Pseudomonadota bacterium]